MSIIIPQCAGDGVTDDTYGFINALNQSQDNLVAFKTGRYKINLTSAAVSALATVQSESVIEGEGYGTIFEIYVNAGSPVTRSLFSLNKSNWILRRFRVRVVSLDAGGNLIVGNLSGGGTDGTIEDVWIDGGVLDTGGAVNWNVFGLSPVETLSVNSTKDFDGLNLVRPRWHSMSRAFLKQNDDHSVQRRIRVLDPDFRDFFRPVFAINSPNGTFDDFLIRGGSSKDCYGKTTGGGGENYHYGLGSGKNVRFVDHYISGAGDGIHLEESTDGAIIKGVGMDLTDTNAIAISTTNNNISGVDTSPKNIIVQGCDLGGPGSANTGAWAIRMVYDDNTPAAVHMLVIDNLIHGWYRGISLDPAMTFCEVSDNRGSDCKTLIYSPTTAQARVHDNSCDSTCDYGAYALTAGASWGIDNEFSSATLGEIADGGSIATPDSTWFAPAPIYRRDKYTWFDDFPGDLLADEWDTKLGSDGGCSVSVISGPVSGTVRLRSGVNAAGTVATNGTQLHAGILGFNPTYGGLFMEARLRLSAVTSVGAFFGFTDQVSALEFPLMRSAGASVSNATDAVGVSFDTGSTDPDNWWLMGVKNDVDATAVDTGLVPVADTYETWQIAVSTAGVASFRRNGKAVGTLSAAVSLSVLLTPVFIIYARGTSVRDMIVDYSLVQASRP